MLKLFNRKKKDNKGFTLVELVIVVAILAILVGILAPQYTKYVEKSRKAADANNLEEIVKQLQVVSSDPQYMVPAGRYVIKITDTDAGTTIVYSAGTTTNAATTSTKADWRDGMISTLEGDWTKADNQLSSTGLKLKSNKWLTTANTDMGATANEHAIYAMVEVSADGTMKVTYNPSSIKEGTN